MKVTRRGFLGGLVSTPTTALLKSRAPELVVSNEALAFDRVEMDARAKREIAVLVQDAIMQQLRRRGMRS